MKGAGEDLWAFKNLCKLISFVVAKAEFIIAPKCMKVSISGPEFAALTDCFAHRVNIFSEATTKELRNTLIL